MYTIVLFKIEEGSNATKGRIPHPNTPDQFPGHKAGSEVQRTVHQGVHRLGARRTSTLAPTPGGVGQGLMGTRTRAGTPRGWLTAQIVGRKNGTKISSNMASQDISHEKQSPANLIKFLYLSNSQHMRHFLFFL